MFYLASFLLEDTHNLNRRWSFKYSRSINVSSTGWTFIDLRYLAFSTRFSRSTATYRAFTLMFLVSHSCADRRSTLHVYVVARARYLDT